MRFVAYLKGYLERYLLLEVFYMLHIYMYVFLTYFVLESAFFCAFFKFEELPPHLCFGCKAYQIFHSFNAYVLTLLLFATECCCSRDG